MRLKSGFVSNSSTTSFVFVGFRANDLHIKEPYEELGDEYDFLYGTEDGLPEDDMLVIGREIFRFDDEDYVTRISGLEEVFAEVEQMREKLRGTDAITLWAGVRTS